MCLLSLYCSDDSDTSMFGDAEFSMKIMGEPALARRARGGLARRVQARRGDAPPQHRTCELDESADDYTVLVHVRSVSVGGRQLRQPYAHWLAKQVGLRLEQRGSPPGRP